MEVLLEVSGYDMFGAVKMTMTQAHIDVQKCDFGGGGVPSDLDGIAGVEVFKELGEGVGTMRPKEENVINKMQPVAVVQVGLGSGHMGAHDSSLNLEVMSGVKGEMVVDEDKLGKLNKELTG